jgi:hypothetical protein
MKLTDSKAGYLTYSKLLSISESSQVFVTHDIRQSAVFLRVELWADDVKVLSTNRESWKNI